LNLIEQFIAQHHPRFVEEDGVYYFLEGDGPNQKRYEIVPYDDIDDLLAQLYAKPEWGLCGRDKFNSKLQRHFANISRTQVTKFLQRQEGHQMTMPNRNIPIVRPIAVAGPFRHWQMDLVDFTRLRFQVGDNHNRGAAWMLTVVDAFSKYGYLRALKRKSAFSVTSALEDVFRESGRVPLVLQSDRGNEFRNARMKALCKWYHIQQHFSDAYKPTSQGQVERMNGTIKSMLSKHFLHSKDHSKIAL